MFSSKEEFIDEVKESMLCDPSIKRDTFSGPTKQYGRTYYRDYSEWDAEREGFTLEEHFRYCIVTDLAMMVADGKIDKKLVALARLFGITDEDIYKDLMAPPIVNMPIGKLGN